MSHQGSRSVRSTLAVPAFALFVLLSASTTFAQVTFETYATQGVHYASHLAMSHDGGTIYLADSRDFVIRKVTGGVVSIVAGAVDVCNFVDGPAATARMCSVGGIAVDAAGNVFFADSSFNRIRKIANGVVSTVAGNGTAGFADGVGAAAAFNSPSNIAFDPSGNLIVYDGSNHAIRRVAPDGTVTTIAGGPSSSVIGLSYGLAVDANGAIYITNYYDHVVEKVVGNSVTVFAGARGARGSVDGTKTSARFNYPEGLTIDAAGNFYVCDSMNHSLRRIGSDGQVTTTGGKLLYPGNREGTGGQARFQFPVQSVVSGSTIYVVDGNDKLWRGVPGISDVAVIDSETGSIAQPRQLTTSGGAATSWQWSLEQKPAGSNASFSSPTSASTSFLGDLMPYYLIRLRASSAAGSSISYVEYLPSCQKPAPPVVTLSTPLACPGELVTYNATPGYAQYRWGSVPGNPNTPTVSMQWNSTVDLGLQAADSIGCWTDWTYFTHHVFGEQVSIAPSGNVSVCATASPVTFTATDAAAGSVTHQWYFTDASGNGVPIAGATNGAYTLSSAPANAPNPMELYSVSSSCGTSVRSNSAYVNLGAGATAAPTILLDAPSLCPQGMPVRAGIDQSSQYATFSWSIVNGAFDSPTDSAYVTFHATSTANVQLTATVSSYGGCPASSTVSVPTRTIEAPAISAPPSVCPNGMPAPASIEPPPTQYSQIVWSIANGAFDSPATGGGVSFHATSTDAVQLTVTVTDYSGCTASSSTTVPTRTIAAPPISAPPSVCPNGMRAPASIEPSTTQYSQIVWSIVNGAFDSPASGSGSVSFHATSTAAVQLTVTVTDYSGCTASSSTTVPTRTIEAPPISAPPSVCPNGMPAPASIDGTSTNYAQIVWSIANGAFDGPASGSGSVSFHATSTASVQLTVTVTDYSGCTASSSTTVPTRTIEAPPISAPMSVCPNGSPAPAGIGAPSTNYAQIVWSIVNGAFDGPTTGSNSVSFHATSSQTVQLTVTVTDYSGCTASSSTTLPTRTIEAPPISAPMSVCPNGSPAPAGIGAPSTNYAQIVWSIVNGAFDGPTSGSNAVSFHATSTASVQLTVTVTDFSGCTATQTVTVATRVPPPPVVTASGATTFCAGNSVTLTADSGHGSYRWSNGATSPSIVVTSSGDYSVIVDELSCSATSAPVTVTVIAPPVAAITASGATTFCAGGSVTLTASAGASYLWSNGATTRAITVNVSGNYSVTVTNANGCSTTSAATPVTVNAPTTPVITAGGATTFCAGGSVTLTASAAASYLWSNGATTQSITVAASGTYSVAATDANGCSATSAATNVTVSPLPAAAVSADGPTTFCAGGSVTLTASAGASYLWSNGATTRAITVTASGNFRVTVANANGCSATSAATSVTVNAPATPVITAGGATTFCAGGSVVLTASPASSYLWSNGATTQSITVATSGAFSVATTDANGCSATSAATNVTVSALPVATVSADGPTTFCDGAHVTLTASAGASYLWSTGATTPAITVNASGNYSVTVTNASGCSATSSATTVVVDPPLAKPTVTSTSRSICAGGTVSMTATATGGSGVYSYQWHHNGGAVIPGATSQSYTATPSANDYYYVAVTDSRGCVTMTSSAVVVTVNALPDATITAASTVCDGSSGSASVADAGAGATYNWTIAGGTIDFTMANGAAAFFHPAAGATTVTVSVSVTTAAGCNATSSRSIAVERAQTPVITTSGATTFCAGGSVTLTAPAAASYAWSNNATTQSIVATATGNYSVTITTANGCTATSAATAVTVNAKPTAAVSGTTSICAGASATISAALTGAAPFSVTWSDGLVQSNINANTVSRSVAPASNTTYTIVAVRDTNCSGGTSTGSAAITVMPRPTAVVTGDSSGCPSTSRTISATLTGTAPFSVTWSDGVVQSNVNATSVTRSVAPAATTTYTIASLSDASCNGGTSSGSAVATVTPAPSIAQQPSNITTTKNTTVTFRVVAAPAALTYQWQTLSGSSWIAATGTGATTANYSTSKQQKGTYSFRVVISDACSPIRSVTSSVVTLTVN
jgi:sugar lactone lactonase YvrE